MGLESKCHLFELSDELIQGCDRNTIANICEDLAATGRGKLPFPYIALKVTRNAIDKWYNFQPSKSVHITHHVFDFVNQFDHSFMAHFHGIVDGYPSAQSFKVSDEFVRTIARPILVNEAGKGWEEATKDLPDADYWKVFATRVQAQCVMVLIASLATRGTIQEVAYNTRTPRGKEPRPQFRGLGTIYIGRTLLKPPTFLGGTHAAPIPHLRRGHPHTYHVGPGRRESIVKELDPCWVNLAEDDEPPTDALARNYVVQS